MSKDPDSSTCETATPAKAQRPFAEIDAAIEPFNRTDSPGVIIAVARHGRLLYRRAVGMASMESGVANTPATRGRIGSTSKHFTALAVMLLAEDGLVDIDAMASTYLRELPRLSPLGPTVRQLMQHTGGWRGHDELWSMSNGLAFHPPGPGMPAMARQSALNFEPGTQMMYSNGGYHMLAKIVERASGLDFNTFLKTRICAPLGMNDTESIATDVEICPGLATPHLPLPGGGWARGIYPCEFDGGGSMVSTVGDMLIWLAHMRSSHKVVGTAETWKQMTAHTTLSSGARVSYGLGLARHDYRGLEIVHHAGAVLGATSQMLTVPAEGLDIIVLVNGAAIGPSPLALKVVELVLADRLGPPIERVPASDFPALAGQRYFSRETGWVIGFADVGGKLGMSVQGTPAIPLRHDEEKQQLWLGLQELPLNDLEVDVSDVDPQRAPETLALREGGQLRSLARLPQTPPDIAALAAQLCGSFHSPDMDATGEIDFEDGELRMAIQGRHGRMACVMDVLSDEVALLRSTDPVLSKLGFLVLAFDREAGRVQGLRVGSLRTRNLHFIRQGARA